MLNEHDTSEVHLTMSIKVLNAHESTHSTSRTPVDTCVYKVAHQVVYSLAPDFWVNTGWQSEDRS